MSASTTKSRPGLFRTHRANGPKCARDGFASRHSNVILRSRVFHLSSCREVQYQPSIIVMIDTNAESRRLLSPLRGPRSITCTRSRMTAVGRPPCKVSSIGSVIASPSPLVHMLNFDLSLDADCDLARKPRLVVRNDGVSMAAGTD